MSTQPESSTEMPRPPQSELERPTAHVLGDGLVKLIGGVVIAGVLGFGGWMLTMYNTQSALRNEVSQTNFKLDLLTEQLTDAKSAGEEAEQQARDNARRLERIEATRFTEQDAHKSMKPLEQRLERIEEKLERRR